MNKDTLSIEIKKSDLNSQNPFELVKIKYGEFFIPVEYEIKEEDIVFTYDVTGMKNVSRINEESIQDRYRFLINLGKLEKVWMYYKYSLLPENIYYDENFIPYIMNRDIYEQGKTGDNSKFVELYKTYIGGILGNKYNIKKLQQSGIEILKNETSFSEFYISDDVSDVINKLRDRRNEFIKKEKNSKVTISKISNNVKTMVSIMASILLLIISGLLIWVYYFRLSYSDTVVYAMESYISLDYIQCINSLNNIEVDDMDKVTKYILAVSYAKTENLKKEEISGIVSGLSVNSDERELEYWIALGRLDVEQAQEISKALSDDKLLIYAYMKELNLLQQDTSKSGTEKQSRINELESNIKELGDKYTQEEVEDASPSDATGE